MKSALLIFPFCCAVLALGSCASKSKETWNSYYYGGYQEIDGKFEYTGQGEPRDNDSYYVSPNNLVNSTGNGVAAPTNSANQFKPGKTQ